MPKPRFRRRKDDRPQEITAAAFDEFANKGYAGTRVEDVAKRAGVSKGLLYLYFKTKEELFEAVVKSIVIRRFDTLINTIETTDMSSEELIRGPILEHVKQIPGSPVAIVVRLLIAEGSRYPELVDFYFDNVVAKGIAAITEIIARGVERGEFKADASSFQPQLFVAPVFLSVIWRSVFSTRPLDTDSLIETQIDLLLARIKA